jgi:glycosyltransferase involved in cell wall biosynthesis
LSLFQIDAGLEGDGSRRTSFLLTRELVAQGFPVCLVLPKDSPLFAAGEAEGLPVLAARTKGNGDFATFGLSRAMRKQSCVLAHFHDARAVTIGGTACARAKVPIRIVSRRTDSRFRLGFFGKRKHTQDVDLIIAVSEHVRDVLVQGGIGPGKIEVIPAGIDFSAYEAADDKAFLRRELGFLPDDFLVGIEAYLEDGKGHRYIIEAARMLRERAPKIKLVILGRGALELGSETLARDLGLGDLAFYLGFKDEAPRIFASLDCFVLSSEQEGPRASIMDAMAAGLPVVATQVGGVPEVVLHDETGFLVSPRSPRALAEAVYSVYKDPGLARRFGERGHQIVHERFSSLAMARRAIALYKRIAYRKMVKLGA